MHYNYNQLKHLEKYELLHLLVKEARGTIKGAEGVTKFFVEFSGLIKDWSKEHFLLLCLSSQKAVLAAEIISIGSVSSCQVNPAEIFKIALTIYGTAEFIIAHNHPSGETTPSASDNELTKRVFDCGNLLGLPLADHVIFSRMGNYYSYKEKGLL